MGSIVTKADKDMAALRKRAQDWRAGRDRGDAETLFSLSELTMVTGNNTFETALVFPTPVRCPGK